MPLTRREFHVDVAADGTLTVDLLHAHSELPKQRIKHAMRFGAVWLTRAGHTARLRRANRSLTAGDQLHLYYDADILAEEPAIPTLVADRDAYSVWDKPTGLRSQGSKWGDHCTVVRCAERTLKPQRNGFTVHRIDRAASGLILVAHTRTMAAALSGLFRERRIEKRYRLVVNGDFSIHRSTLAVNTELDGKSAHSEFTYIAPCPELRGSTIEARIATGRKHQIRRHLAAVGFPIVGDRLYGAAAPGDVDLQLRACLLAFHCPHIDAPVEYRLD